MSIDHLDYELAEAVTASAPDQLRALADPLRSVLLDLVLERAATVRELSAAVGRPKSTVAHHVRVLTDAGLLRVVRTRRVKAIDERWYGRTGRRIDINPADPNIGHLTNLLAEAAAEAEPAARRDDLRSTSRHVRVPLEVVDEFWDRVLALADDLVRVPRAGETVFGFVAAFYPTDQPTLPEPDVADQERPPAGPPVAPAKTSAATTRAATTTTSISPVPAPTTRS